MTREIPHNHIKQQLVNFTCHECGKLIAPFKEAGSTVGPSGCYAVYRDLWKNTCLRRHAPKSASEMDARFPRVPLLLLLAAFALSLGSDPEYDHQTSTYGSKYKGTYCRTECTVTPYFSPDHSIKTYISLIEAAETSIDLMTPGVFSRHNGLPLKPASYVCVNITIHARMIS